MSKYRRNAKDPTGFGMSADEITRLCLDVPSNWEIFSARLQSDWQRWKDPAAPAKALLVAGRISKDAPAWARSWLDELLAAGLAGRSLDTASGFKSDRKGRGDDLLERREIRRVYEYAGLVMRLRINEGGDIVAASVYTERQLRKQMHYALSAKTLRKYWRQGKLPDPDLTPSLPCA